MIEDNLFVIFEDGRSRCFGLLQCKIEANVLLCFADEIDAGILILLEYRRLSAIETDTSSIWQSRIWQRYGSNARIHNARIAKDFRSFGNMMFEI